MDMKPKAGCLLVILLLPGVLWEMAKEHWKRPKK